MTQIIGYDAWKLDYTDGADFEGEDTRQCAFCDSFIPVETKSHECPVCLEDEENEDAE